jgi:GNAT superfamily N-acetyltransferase
LGAVEDRVDIRPVDPPRWDDLEELFGPNGAYANCWCTWFLLSGKEWKATDGDGRRHRLRSEVEDGHQPGLLAYLDGSPVGWCAVGPRDRYARMMSPRAKVYRRLDDRPTLVINCFYIRTGHRRAGIAGALLEAAVDFAFEQGAEILEGYPIDRAVRPGAGADTLFVGTLAMFEAAGFEEVARFDDRPLVRRYRR